MIKLILVFVISCISLSDACSCFQPTPGWEVEAYCNSGFAGVIKVLGASYICGSYKICYPIGVIQQLHGNPINPTVLETANQSAACGITLTPGNTYFLATNPINAVRISAYMCGLLQDWSTLTCCEIIAKGKQFDCNNIPITPIDNGAVLSKQ